MAAQDMPMTRCHFDSNTAPILSFSVIHTAKLYQRQPPSNNELVLQTFLLVVLGLHSLKVSPLQFHIDLSSVKTFAEASSCHLRCQCCERGTARPSGSIIGGLGKKKLTNW